MAGGLKISSLRVQNFRNLHSNIIRFSSKINCLFGENGNGKTNILEAIYMLANRKSFRKNTGFPQVLSIDGEEPEIIFSSVLHSEDEIDISYSGKLFSEGSNWYLDGKPQKRKPEIEVVFIGPSDAQNFFSKASERRIWVDTHLSKIDTEYKRNHSRYVKALRFRNSLLSNKPRQYREQISTINKELAQLSVLITAKRLEFLKSLSSFCRDVFKEIFSEEHSIQLELKSDLKAYSENDFLEMWQKYLPKEEIIGHTLKGIHKDDYLLLFDGMDAVEFCSLGQQKMAFFSLLFAYISLFRYIFRTFPVVLLDDVSGELDRNRWQRLVRYLEKGNFQALITTANESFREELEKIDGAQKIFVEHGEISCLQ